MIDSEEKESYKQSLKNTSLLGGVQIVNILITIIRSKCIAVLLGPTGMGIHGLFTSTTSTITAFTNLGLSVSAVKDIAQANSTNDLSKVSRVISVFRKLVWITGFLGLFVCLFFSPFLSKVTFGNTDYILGFSLLSITLLLAQLSAGQTTVMQGVQKFSWMAKASLYGSVAGLLISVPLYYWGRENAIVPVIVIISIVNLFFSWFFSRRLKIQKTQLSLSVAVREGVGMIKMGFFLGFQSALTVLSAYLVRIFISNLGGVSEVGLYTAGFAIVNTYVGLIFNAMSTEYYPRLATHSKEKEKFIQTINQQMEISILLLSPIVIFFIIFVDLGIILLYSRDFLAINSMLYFTILGMFFRAPSWCIAFSFIAKGDTNTFFLNELVSVIYATILNILFYKYLGLMGMGISFLLIYVIYWIQVLLITKKKYDFIVSQNFWRKYVIHFLISVIGVLIVIFFKSKLLLYIFGSLLIIFSLFFSLKELNKRIDLVNWVKQRRKTYKS